MILRKMILENFRQIYGRNEIRFALPGDRNVTVVLGQNGSGKTTLLNAFLWCLYERLEVENPTEIVTHKAIQEASIGDKVGVEVTLVLQDGPKSYSVKRRLTYQKLDGGKIEEMAPGEFRIDVMDPNGVTNPAPDPRQFVRQMLPDGLSGFFFFRGEDMENLALQSSGPELEQGVAEFLNFTLLDRAIKHLRQVGKDFETEVAKIAVGDTKRLTDGIASEESELDDANARLDNEKKNIQELSRRREEIEKQLAESRETQPLLEQRTTLVARKEALEKNEAEYRHSLAAIVSRDGFLGTSDTLLGVPLALADQAVQRGEIPAKIKPQFVDDLIALGNCICGRPVDNHAREHLLRWRGVTGLAAIEEGINQLRNAVTRLRTRRERFRQDCDAQRTAWAEAKEAIRKTVEAISAIDSELQGKDFGLDEIRALQSRLREVCDDLIHRNAETTRAGDAVAATEKRLDALRADLKRLAKDNEQIGKIQRRFDATENIVRALTKMRQGWLAIVQEYLNGQLKYNWERVAHLDRLVEFTPNFRLSIKEKGPDGNWTTSAPSSANLRALALCFVSALIKLAHDIGVESRQKEEQSRRQSMFQGGEYPLVMDAPFATMDRYLKRTVPTGLRSVVPQMVILSNHDQWTGEVEGVLRPAMGAVYVLELHLPGGQDQSASIEFNGRPVDYVVGEPEAPTDWTIIHEVLS